MNFPQSINRLADVLKRRWRVLLAVVVAFVVAIVGLNYWVVRSAEPFVASRIDELPENGVGLVLGTSRWLSSGRENLHFRSRINGAAELFRAGKVRHLLLSGDNHTADYNEARDMQDALLALGVPESAMTLDYAGFRTLDSVVRAHKVFGQTKLTVITDDFHIHRAVFLARHFGLDAVGFSSGAISLRYSARSRVREVGARVKAVLDLYVLRTTPKFLGEPVTIKIAAGR